MTAVLKGSARAADSPLVKDSGSIVFGWLTRVALALALMALVLFDGIALLRANVSAADHANSAAIAGAAAYRQSKDVQQAYAAAIEVTGPDDTLPPQDFVVDPTTGTVRLTLTQEAVTLWLHRLPPLRRFTTAHAEGSASLRS